MGIGRDYLPVASPQADDRKNTRHRLIIRTATFGHVWRDTDVVPKYSARTPPALVAREYSGLVW